MFDNMFLEVKKAGIDRFDRNRTLIKLIYLDILNFEFMEIKNSKKIRPFLLSSLELELDCLFLFNN